MLTKKTKNGLEILPQTNREQQFLRLLRELLENFFPAEDEEEDESWRDRKH